MKSNTKIIDKYIPSAIEANWQKKWKEEGIYEFKPESSKEKYYNLVELPYPSGDLHLGHWFTFTTADAHARYQRMIGRNVFFPNGFDAFGLPAENAAIKRGIHPRDWTLSNIETMKKQFATMGTMIDWSHEAITCLPEYYRWNQWIFLKMHEKGLAYRGKSLSNWCPSCQTVLANEGIEDGKCWRCGNIVEQKEIEQWFLKITEYADRLLWPDEKTDPARGLHPTSDSSSLPSASTVHLTAEDVDWPKSVREGQNNWIGRSEGAKIQFQISNFKYPIEVFTTRPDTLFGATFLVLAPEHPFVASLLNSNLKTKNSNLKEVEEYVVTSKQKTEIQRKESNDKTGVFSGAYAINPINSQHLPIWIADYVLSGYGTGAIMAVPAHDARDYEFAKKYSLPIQQVIQGRDNGGVEERAYVGDGVLINSGEYDGLGVDEAKKSITKHLLSVSKGCNEIVYHLHDWSVSRQRYWGTPVPMIHCDACGIVPVNVQDLPIELPYEVDYMPKGKPPLATAEEWMKVSCPKCGGEAKRDPETLDTFFDSSWYFYRYINPKYDLAVFDRGLAQVLMPVDIYYGGAEHTLGHTLYARFFTKFFHDLGIIDIEEFAKKRVQHGVILGPDGYRMSKSRGNVVNPDDVVKEYGSDTVRLYLCFMMPYEATAPWNPGAISGVYRFLRRVWEMQGKVQMANGKWQMANGDKQMMAKTIKKVGEDLRDIKFNTAVASLMEWLNFLSRKKDVSIDEYKTLILLIAPLAPHFSEEVWQRIKIGMQDKREEFRSVHLEEWPKFDKRDLEQDIITIVVQINGKVRDSMQVQSAKCKVQSEVEILAKNSLKVKRYLEGKSIKKVIFVPGRAINFVF